MSVDEIPRPRLLHTRSFETNTMNCGDWPDLLKELGAKFGAELGWRGYNKIYERYGAQKIRYSEEWLTILRVEKNSYAAAVGVKKSDIILAINGIDIVQSYCVLQEVKEKG